MSDTVAVQCPEVSQQTEILRLMAHGYTNKQILFAIGFRLSPEIFENDYVRKEANGGNFIAYSQEKKENVQNAIRVARNSYEKEKKKQENLDSVIGRSSSIKNFDEIEEMEIDRFSLGYSEIDRVFGSSKVYDKDMQGFEEIYGTPRGMIVLIGGEEGVGKTRFYTAVTSAIVDDHNRSVCVFQAEMDEGQYKSMANSIFRANRNLRIKQGTYNDDPHAPLIKNPNNFLIGGKHHRNLHDQIKIIKDTKPDLVIVDSYNMIRGAKSNQGIEDIVFFYKEAIANQTSVWFIAHLNEKGEIKGNNHIRYLVDTVMIMKKEFGLEGSFSLSSPTKNRGGKTGMMVNMRHYEGAVIIEQDKREVNPSPLMKSSLKMSIKGKF